MKVSKKQLRAEAARRAKRTKITIVSVCLAVAMITTVLIVVLSQQSSEPPVSNSILSVEGVYTDPLSFEGEITINGVLQTKLDGGRFTIIDTAEAKGCGIGCAPFNIVASYDGNLPEAGDEINVSGRFVANAENTNDVVFEITSVVNLGSVL